MGQYAVLRRVNPEEFEACLREEPGEAQDENDEHHLDKMWHALHFLLTGSAWEGKAPLNFIISGGQTIGVESDDLDDVDWVPERGFTPNQVREIELALRPISGDTIKSRFEPKEMDAQGIYPEVWDREDEQAEVCEALGEYYDEMKQFIAETAERGYALIVSLG